MQHEAAFRSVAQTNCENRGLVLAFQQLLQKKMTICLGSKAFSHSQRRATFFYLPSSVFLWTMIHTIAHIKPSSQKNSSISLHFTYIIFKKKFFLLSIPISELLLQISPFKHNDDKALRNTPLDIHITYERARTYTLSPYTMHNIITPEAI